MPLRPADEIEADVAETRDPARMAAWREPRAAKSAGAMAVLLVFAALVVGSGVFFSVQMWTHMPRRWDAARVAASERLGAKVVEAIETHSREHGGALPTSLDELGNLPRPTAGMLAWEYRVVRATDAAGGGLVWYVVSLRGAPGGYPRLEYDSRDRVWRRE